MNELQIRRRRRSTFSCVSAELSVWQQKRKREHPRAVHCPSDAVWGVSQSYRDTLKCICTFRRLRGTSIALALRRGHEKRFIQHLGQKFEYKFGFVQFFRGTSQFSSMFLTLNFASSTGSIKIFEKCDRPRILCTRDAAIKPPLPIVHPVSTEQRPSSFTTRQSNYFFSSNPQWISTEASRQMNDRNPLNFSGNKERSQVRNMMMMLCNNPEQLLKLQIDKFTPPFSLRPKG